MITSSWEETKAKSSHHFDPKIKDTFESVLTYLGHINPDWQEVIKTIETHSMPATWATRGYKDKGVRIPSQDLLKEEYDLERTGYNKDHVITHLNWNIPDVLQKYVDQFALEDCMSRLHIQKPGEVWNLHLDKLQKWAPDDPASVMRIFIQLTDWQPGQFWEYGNYHWNQWRAGDVVTFDWKNIPHSTANAGHHARITLQLTGIVTNKTQEYISNLSK